MSAADSGIIDVAKRDLFLAKIRTDFSFFLDELWKDRGYNSKAPLDRIEYDMAKWIQHGPSQRGILGARGIGKTYLGTASFTAFRFLQDPERKILLVSDTGKVMREVLGLVREWFDHVWFLQHLAPTKYDVDTAHAFDIGCCQKQKQPSMKAEGLGGQLESNRAHTIVADDIETKNNTKTHDARETLFNTLHEMVNILYPDLPDDPDIIRPLFPTEIVIFGTVKCERTVYPRLVEAGYEFRSYPMVYPTPEEVKGALGMAPIILKDIEKGYATYKGKRHPAEPGKTVFPRRFTQAVVDKRRYGERRKDGTRKGGLPLSEWLKEYQLQTNLSISMPYKLKLRDLMVMDVDRNTAPIGVAYGVRDSDGSTALDIYSHGHGTDCFYRPMYIEPKRAPYSGTKAYIDPAGRGTDKVGLACVGHLGGILHVKGVYGYDGGYDDDTLAKICRQLRKDGVNEVYCEQTFGGGMYDKALKPFLEQHYLQPEENPEYPQGWRCSIVHEPKVTQPFGMKEERILEIIELYTSQHRVVVDVSVASSEAFQMQYTRLRAEKGSLGYSPNELDALAGAFLAWKHTLELDPEKQRARLGKETEEEDFEKLRDFLHGKKRHKMPANWLNSGPRRR